MTIEDDASPSTSLAFRLGKVAGSVVAMTFSVWEMFRVFKSGTSTGRGQGNRKGRGRNSFKTRPQRRRI